MGRAIVRQPRAFLMDEPLSNLDAKLRVQMRAEIGQLQRSLGVTTIYVTHDQTEAMTLGTKVAVIAGGELQQLAPPAELYRRPVNLFVAGFIGSPPMNLIDAVLERGGASGLSDATGPEVVFGPHRLRVPPQVIAEHPGLENYLGQGIVLGIRPEHLSDASLKPTAEAGSVIELPVKLREELGSEVHLHGALGEAAYGSGPGADDVRSLATLVAKVDPRTKVAVGETAQLTVDCDQLHFFDPTTGASIRS
jgi:multiple sugar transport system ATP-binding protein